MKIAIIGGGMAGLGVAYELLGKGHTITLFEKSSQLGGLAASVTVGGVPIEQYYHHLFPTYHDFWEVAKTLGFYDKVFFKKATTALYYDGVLYPFTGALDLLSFTPLPLAGRLKTGLFTIYCKGKRNWRDFENISAADWLKRHLGEDAYRVIWKPLLESKFGAYANEISMVWLWGRIYERPSKFGYFEGGFFTFINAVAEHLKQSGVIVHAGSAVRALSKTGNSFVITSDAGTDIFDQVIVAAPPAAFQAIAGSVLPDDAKRALQGYPYLGTICVILGLTRRLTNNYWVNVNDATSPFVVAIEQTNFVSEKTYGGLHPMYLARYLVITDPLFQLGEEELLARFFAKLKEIFPNFSEKLVAERHVGRAPYTQPVVTVGYGSRRPAFRTAVPGLWWVSMSHIYPWDRGTDHSFHAGRELSRELLVAC